MDAASAVVSVISLVFLLMGMGIIFYYIFSLRNMSIKKMKQRVFFQMLFDDFKQIKRVETFFYTVFFFKRILYAMVLVFMAEVYIVPLNIFIFFVTMIPMLFMTFTVPFNTIFFNALLCLNEGSEVFVAIMLIHYNDQWMPDDEFFGYGKLFFSNCFSPPDDNLHHDLDPDKLGPVPASLALRPALAVLQHVHVQDLRVQRS
jgi:hypothetical protein